MSHALPLLGIAYRKALVAMVQCQNFIPVSNAGLVQSETMNWGGHDVNLLM